MKRSATPYAGTLLVLSLLILAACGGDGEAASETDAMDETPEQEEAGAVQTPPAEKLNLNTATGEQFLTVPGVGERMVHEFEEYRPYVSIQQFRREIGKYVDEAQVTAYEDYVFVPVDPNESDAETLQQLPGVDAAEAGELVAGRPYASRAAFLERLADYSSESERAEAEAYLTGE